ncbi:MAG: hypothetical protein M3R55_06145 [Acidobacteriota bacterium]|nr:hypothetical protein [Acidobacteriota bacterium]
MGRSGGALPARVHGMSGVLSLSVAGEGCFDGVGDFAARLASSLEAGGVIVTRVTRDAIGSWRALPPAAGRGVVLHYVAQPFFAADLLALSAWLRRARVSGSPVVIVVHEYMPPRDTVKRRIASAAFGWALRRLLRSATSLVVTHDVARRELEAMGFTPGATVVPVGSTIDDAGTDAPAGTPDARPYVVMFGQPASFDAALVAAIANRARAGIDLEVVWFTRSEREARDFCAGIGVAPEAMTIRGGRDGAEISRAMAGALAAIAPIVDGVSTRRTSVAALLAHGLPVIGTDGACTAPELRASGAFLLSAPDDHAAFLDHMRGVAPGRTRDIMSRAARVLHGRVFAWPAIAASYQDLLRTA